MANYYDREEDRYRGETRYRGDAGYRGERYGGAYERDSGWEGAGEREGRYGTGSADDYGHGYGSRYYTGDDQRKGFTGGRDLGGRSYRSSYDRDWAETPSSERGYNREYGRSYGSAGFDDRQARGSEREYQGTFRPPNYGRDFQTNQPRTYRSENTAGDRDWLDRASDEVSSWFGDDDDGSSEIPPPHAVCAATNASAERSGVFISGAPCRRLPRAGRRRSSRRRGLGSTAR